MINEYLLYIKPQRVKERQKQTDLLMRHTASEQLGKVKLGDVLWLVTAPDGIGDLYLWARIVVGWKGDQPRAADQLDVDESTLHGETWHVIAEQGTGEPHKWLLISAEDAERLRFVSSDLDRLRVQEGKVNPQQIQAMRLLQPESVDLLESLWNED